MKKAFSLALIAIGTVISLLCAVMLFILSGEAIIRTTAALTAGITVFLVGLHLKLNLLNKEYFYFYIIPLYLFLIGVMIHHGYTGETDFKDVLMGYIPNGFMIGGCIIGFLLKKKNI